MKSSILFAAAAVVAATCINPVCIDKAFAADGSAAKNKETARVWYEEVIVKKNAKPLDTILAKGVVMELSPSYTSAVNNSNKLTGADQVKKHAANVNKAGDFSGAIVDIVAEGNKVAMYRVVTQKLPDGRTTIVPWVSFFEFDNAGKITKIKHVHDTLGEKQQLDKAAAAKPAAKAPAKTH